MIRVHVIFTGHVQHCGFRYYTWKMCKKVGNITGWVKNRSDGSVEMEAQGQKEDITHFIYLIRKGAASIRVDQAEITEIDCVPDEKLYQVIR